MLNASERIRLIMEIAVKLESNEYNIIDLILNQFHVPTRQFWDGDKHGYVIDAMPQAADSDILALANHLGLANAQVPTATNIPTATSIWAEGKFRLFVSHLAKHKQEAGELRDWLAMKSVSAFVAHDDIEPTKEWQDVILDALATADAMVVMLRDGFHESNWTDQEIGFAVARKILVVPVRLGVDPYGFIGKYQGVNGRNNGVDKKMGPLSAEIVEILATHLLSAKAMAEALVFEFEHSSRFAAARENAKLLMKAAYWDRSLTERCEATYESNNQINNINGVRESLEAVYRKWSR